MRVHRRGKVAALLLFGVAAYLAAESFQPPRRQPTAWACLAAIEAYQSAGSPLVKACGVHCRYTPTCSHYAEEAVAYYGTIEGLARTGGRLWRCSPWGGCGHDPAVASSPGGASVQESPEDRRAREEAERRAREEAERLGREVGEGCAKGGAACIIFLLFGLVGLAVTIFILVWVYKDAKARGDQNAVIWIILIIVASWIGLIIYLVVRPKGDLVPCGNCHNKKLATLTRCPHCQQESGAGGTVAK